MQAQQVAHTAHVQNLFEELQITASASVNYVDCALTSNCDAYHSCQQQSSQVQLKSDREMQKLLEMAASMRSTSHPAATKHTTSIAETDLPAPVRFRRANRKISAAKDL
jgi:hypothetical protein